ncbi:hypothetical protein HK405_000821, partial [Cladochytrium tenue]
MRPSGPPPPSPRLHVLGAAAGTAYAVAPMVASSAAAAAACVISPRTTLHNSLPDLKPPLLRCQHASGLAIKTTTRRRQPACDQAAGSVSGSPLRARRAVQHQQQLQQRQQQRWVHGTRSSHAPTFGWASAAGDASSTAAATGPASEWVLRRLDEYAGRQVRQIAFSDMLRFGRSPSAATLLRAGLFLSDELAVRMARRWAVLGHMPFGLATLGEVATVRGWYAKSFAQLLEFRGAVERWRADPEARARGRAAGAPQS